MSSSKSLGANIKDQLLNKLWGKGGKHRPEERTFCFLDILLPFVGHV